MSKTEASRYLTLNWGTEPHVALVHLEIITTKSIIIMKQVVMVSGAHSSGKSTLCRALKCFVEGILGSGSKCVLFEEAGRTVLARMGITREELSEEQVRKAYQKELLKFQHEQHTAGATQEAMVAIFDRSVVDNLAYCRRYVGEEFYNEVKCSNHAKECLQMFKDSSVHYFVIIPTEECMQDDGQRMVTSWEDHQELTQVMIKILKEHEIEYLLIDVLELPSRVQTVVQHLGLEKQ